MSNDQEYYSARAIDALSKAEAASDETVAIIHRQLARRYQALARQGGKRALQIVQS